MLMVTSCQKEVVDRSNNTSVELELREDIAWCDHDTSPPPVVMTNVVDTGKECCITFQVTDPSLTGGYYSLTTYDYDWNGGLQGTGDTQTYGSSFGNAFTVCFPQTGSHFLLTLTDENGRNGTCNEFENPCN